MRGSKNILRLFVAVCALVALKGQAVALHSEKKSSNKKDFAAGVCNPENITLTHIQPVFAENNSGLQQVPMLLIDIPVTLVEKGYWKTLMSPQARVDKIIKTIQTQAAANAQISERLKKGELNPSAITKIAAQLAEPYRGGAFPDRLALTKEGTYRVLQVLIEKQLRLLALPCRDDKDISTLTDYLLKDFKDCLDRAQNTDEYGVCVKSVGNSIHFNVGQAVLQAVLRNNLKEFYPPSAEGQRQMNAQIQLALKYYDDCAFNRILPNQVQDKETQVKVCAAESIFRSVHSYAEAKMESELKSLGKDLVQIDELKKSIFATLKNPPCPFAEQLKNAGRYSAAQYASIENIFVAKPGKNSPGFDQLKGSLLVCANSLTTQAGALIVKEKIKTHPMVLAQYPAEKANFVNHLADDAVAKAYLPCIQRQLANKDKSGGLHLVDPKLCEDSIIGYIGKPILDAKIPAELDKMLQTFTDEQQNSAEIIQEAKRIKKSALNAYDACNAKFTVVDQSAMVGCLQSTIQQFAANYSSLFAKKALGHPLAKEDSGLDGELRSLATSCVQKKLANVKELAQVQAAMDGIGQTCALQISKQMLPRIAGIKVKDIFAAQKVSSDDFMQSHFNLQVEHLNNDLAAAKTPQDEQHALDSFQTRLSWDALTAIATAKSASLVPLLDEKSGLAPYKIEAHNKQVLEARKEVADYLHQNESEFLTVTDAKLRDQKLNDIQQHITLKLADFILRKNLAKFNFEEAILIKTKLIAELKSCLADPKNKDCSDRLVQSATWIIYSHTVDVQVKDALRDIQEKDPLRAGEIIQMIHDKFLSAKDEASLKAVANDDKKRDELLRAAQINIASEIADTFVRDAMKKYYGGSGSTALYTQYEKQLKECMEKVGDPFGSPAFSEKIKKCATEVAAHTAIDIGVQREKPYVSRSPHPAMGIPARNVPTAKAVSSVDDLALYTANACYYLRAECTSGVKALHAEIDNYLLNNPDASADSLVSHIKKSAAMDFLVKGALALQLDQMLVKNLLPLKDPLDKFDLMENKIYGISSGNFLDSLVQKDQEKNGTSSFLYYVKDRLAASRKYSPATDPIAQAKFKGLLLADIGEGSLTDRVLEALARPVYEQAVKDKKSSNWWIITGVFASSDVGNYHRAVMKTKSGLAAREYFVNNVLKPMVVDGKSFSAAEINNFKSELKAKLSDAAGEIPYGKE